MVKVLLVDDHHIVRSGISALLQRHDKFEVVGEVSNGRTAVAESANLLPDVVVMDVSMPEVNGIEATREICAQHGERVRVLGLSAYGGRGHVQSLLKAGGSGYVLKDCVLEELVDAIETVARGGRYLGEKLRERALDDCIQDSHGRSDHGLSRRENEVMQLLVRGHSTKEVASALQISGKTVEAYRRSLMEKLHITSIVDLTKHALREGYAMLD